MTSEIKFLVDAARAASIVEWARANMEADPHGGGAAGDRYEVTSLYFDTPERDVLNRRGSYGRSKYRIRRYERAEAVFLERKMKAGDLVGKTRSLVPVEELARLEEAGLARGWAGYWFQRRLRARRLEVVSQISYLRTARLGMAAGGPVRLTVDEDIRVVAPEGLRFAESGAGRCVLDGQKVLELKFQREMPAVFKELMRFYGLNAQAVSKYRLAAQHG